MTTQSSHIDLNRGFERIYEGLGEEIATGEIPDVSMGLLYLAR